MKKIISLLVIILLIVGGAFAFNLYSDKKIIQNEITTTARQTVTVTFPEGLTVSEIANKLEKNGVCSAEDFMNEINSEHWAEEYDFLSGLENTDKRAFLLEGYIFPDTYEFYLNEKPTTTVSRFLNNTKSKLSDEMRNKAEEAGFSMDEIITLASIIQKEAGDPKEMNKVSSVLHNRIKSPAYGKLQCDVTINYVRNDIEPSPFIEGDKERFGEFYNTYKVSGVPVGAICCPGLDAINAALEPAETDYFFFVTDKEKNYYYSSTYAQHLENCKICGIEF